MAHVLLTDSLPGTHYRLLELKALLGVQLINIYTYRLPLKDQFPDDFACDGELWVPTGLPRERKGRA